MLADIEELVTAFDRANAHLVAGTKTMLTGFIGDRPTHARFMNTLSLLEHIGSYKIMATQHGLGIDQATLKHLAEETRHAFFFKRHANREAGRTLEYSTSDMIAPSAARRYFHRLEAEMVHTFPMSTHPRAIYLTMSMVIEFRAVWGYRLYQAALVKAGSLVSLKSLLAEEASHLTDMAERLQRLGELDIDRLDQFCAVETALYERLLVAFGQPPR